MVWCEPKKLTGGVGFSTKTNVNRSAWISCHRRAGSQHKFLDVDRQNQVKLNIAFIRLSHAMVILCGAGARTKPTKIHQAAVLPLCRSLKLHKVSTTLRSLPWNTYTIQSVSLPTWVHAEMLRRLSPHNQSFTVKIYELCLIF